MATTSTTEFFVLVSAISIGDGDWTVISVNSCGQSIDATGWVEVVLSGDDRLGLHKVYPIPADSYIEIVADESRMDTSEESVETQLANSLMVHSSASLKPPTKVARTKK